MRKRLSTEHYVDGIRKGDRGVLSKAITLVESQLEEDKLRAREVLKEIMPLTGNSLRIAVTGVPGAGKSTFIEALGQHVIGLNKKIAVLAVDPSSSISGGSILGDKTRMDELSKNPNAYIRPTPTGNFQGGIARKTRETILLCEAAGFEVLLIETVGVGQIEFQVHGMVDLFLLIMLTGGGDELQMIKKGIMEMADIIVINKADGANETIAGRTKIELESVLNQLPKQNPDWATRVFTSSSLNKIGMEAIWTSIVEYKAQGTAKGYFQQKRQSQNIQWMRQIILEMLETDFYSNELIKSQLSELESEVGAGKIPAIHAAEKLFKIFKR